MTDPTTDPTTPSGNRWEQPSADDSLSIPLDPPPPPPVEADTGAYPVVGAPVPRRRRARALAAAAAAVAVAGLGGVGGFAAGRASADQPIVTNTSQVGDGGLQGTDGDGDQDGRFGERQPPSGFPGGGELPGGGQFPGGGFPGQGSDSDQAPDTGTATS